MTVKDFTTLKADISVAIPDNATRDVDPVDVRQIGFIDAIDSLSLLATGPITFATQQIGFTPQAAQTGSWRTVSDVDFQGGLTMDGEDFVIFRNCKFGGPVVLGATTPCDRVKFVECTSTGVTGTFLTATSCDRLTLDGLVITNPTSEGILLTTCTRAILNDIEIDNASNTAVALTTLIVRVALFGSVTNLRVPDVVFAAVHLDGCTTVLMDSVELNNCRRTGIYVKDCTDISIREIVTEGGHLFVDQAIEINDDPILILDSTHVRVSGGKILNSGRHGVYIIESPPTVYAGGLGLKLNNILVEKLHIQMHPDDNPGIGRTTSFGIFVDGGAEIRIQYNEIAFSGQSGIEFNTFGTDRAKVLYNHSHGNGQNTDEVHWDGFSFLHGCGLILEGNSLVDNYRNGVQLKPGFADEGSFHGEYPLADALISKNAIFNNGRGSLSWGIQIVESGAANGASVDRVTISQNVVFSNSNGNILFTEGTGNVMLIDNHFGESAALSNVRWQSSHNVSVTGGFVHFNEVTGQNFGVRASDNIGASFRGQIIGTHFQGVDVAALNRTNLALAINDPSTNPASDTLTVALANATATAGRDIRLYKYLQGTTGGAADIRDISEIDVLDRGTSSILIDGDAPVFFFANTSDLLSDTPNVDVQTQDTFKVLPAQLLLSVNAGGTGPGWVTTDSIFVNNGFAPMFAISDSDSNTVVDKIELMMLEGWRTYVVAPATGDRPELVAIADGNVEATPGLVPVGT